MSEQFNRTYSNNLHNASIKKLVFQETKIFFMIVVLVNYNNPAWYTIFSLKKKKIKTIFYFFILVQAWSGYACYVFFSLTKLNYH